MSAAEVAAQAATTDWTTYDGVVPQKFMFYAVFFPLAMALFLMLPAAICYCCLARGRVTPYTPPNMAGAFGMLFTPSSSSYGRFALLTCPQSQIGKARITGRSITAVWRRDSRYYGAKCL